MRGKIGQAMRNEATPRQAFSPLVRRIANQLPPTPRVEKIKRRRQARRYFNDDFIAKLRWVLEDGIYSRQRIADMLDVPVHTIAGIATGANYSCVMPIKDPDWEFVAKLRAGAYRNEATR